MLLSTNPLCVRVSGACAFVRQGCVCMRVGVCVPVHLCVRGACVCMCVCEFICVSGVPVCVCVCASSFVCQGCLCVYVCVRVHLCVRGACVCMCVWVRSQSPVLWSTNPLQDSNCISRALSWRYAQHGK